MRGGSRLWCVELPEFPFNTVICLCLEFTFSGASLSTSEISAGSVSDRPVRRKLLAPDSLYTWYADPWAPRITETVKYCCKLWEQFLCMFDERKSVEMRRQEGDGSRADAMSSRFLFRPPRSHFILSEFFPCLMFCCECSTAVKVHIAFRNDSRLCAGWVRVSSWLCGCGIWLPRPLNGALCVFRGIAAPRWWRPRRLPAPPKREKHTKIWKECDTNACKKKKYLDSHYWALPK